MADEDLIFRLEGVGGQTPRAGRDGASDTDSEDEDGYFICPITDEPRSHQLVSAKANARYGDLMRREQYGSSGSPAGSFSFKVSGPPAPCAQPKPPPPGAGRRGLWLGSSPCLQTRAAPRIPDLRPGLFLGWRASVSHKCMTSGRCFGTAAQGPRSWLARALADVCRREKGAGTRLDLGAIAAGGGDFNAMPLYLYLL